MLRYAQQIIVPEIGIEGQQRIAAAKVLIVGAGGVGTPVACYLAAGGIGNIGIMDGDKVDASNLHRQFLYHENDMGQNKAEVLVHKLRQQNPSIQITAIQGFLNQDMAEEIFSGFDIICDCTDNVTARVIIDQTCGNLKKPLVYAAVREWEGYVSVFHYKKEVKLFDIFPEQAFMDEATNNCSISGVINTTCGIAGSIQAAEVFKILSGSENVLDGSLLCFNSLVNKFRTLQINQPH
jgi:molybdopterin/thiamine biosynthesis adenylyltransferase